MIHPSSDRDRDTVGIPDVWLTSWIVGRMKALQVIGPPGTAEMAGHLAQAYQWDHRHAHEGCRLSHRRRAAGGDRRAAGRGVRA
jgi:hypothetical protein